MARFQHARPLLGARPEGIDFPQKPDEVITLVQGKSCACPQGRRGGVRVMGRTVQQLNRAAITRSRKQKIRTGA